MDTSFNLGYALSAVRLMKEEIYDLAYELLYKSMFYATRNLVYTKQKRLFSGYKNIYEEAVKLDIPSEYRELLDAGINLRNDQQYKVDNSLFYKNISYINKFVIRTIDSAQIFETHSTHN